MMWKAAILLACAMVSAAGCTSTRALTPVERPALEVPPVPPRIIEPAPPPNFGGVEKVPPLPPQDEPKPAASPRPSPPRTAAAKEPPKPEAKPEEVPQVAAEQVQTPPVPVLRTQATQDTAAVARQITDTIGRAQKILDDVDYGRLSVPRQKAYNEVKDFITSAERELKLASFDLAKDFAEKAEKYATALQQGR